VSDSNIKIDRETHKQIKSQAALEGKTIKQKIREIFEKATKKEKLNDLHKHQKVNMS